MEQAVVSADRSLEPLHQRVDQLSDMLALDEAVMRASSLAEAVAIIVEGMTKLLDVEQATVFLYDPTTNLLVAQNAMNTVSGGLIERLCLPVGPRGRGAHVFRTGTPCVANDMAADRLAVSYYVKLLGMRRSLTVPLDASGQRIGVLNVSNKHGSDFSDEDLELVCHWASHLALLLQNARRFEAERQTVAALQVKNGAIEGERQKLRQTLAIHGELTHGVLEGKDAAAIIVDLGQLLGVPVALEDHSGNLIGCYYPPDGGGTDEGWRRTIAIGGTSPAVRENPEIQVALAGAVREGRPIRLSPVPGLDFNRPRVFTPVLAGATILGWICVLESSRTLDEMDIVTVEATATLVALVMKGEATAKLRRQRHGDFVAELIDGHYGADAVLLTRGTAQGICNLRAPRAVLVIDVDDPRGHGACAGRDDSVNGLRAKLSDAVERICRQPGPEAVVSARNDHIVVLANAPGVGDAHRRACINGFLDTLRTEVARILPDLSFSVGIGACCYGPSEYPQSYVQARRALDVIKACQLYQQRLSFDQLGIYEVLLDGHNRGALLSFMEGALGSLIEYDRQHKSELVQTLEQYLQRGCHLEETASVLRIHLNTLRYRLQRIEQVTGTSLHSPEGRLTLQLACKVLHIADQRHESQPLSSHP